MHLLFVYVALPLKGEEFGRFFNITRQHCRIWRIIGTELGIDGELLKTIQRSHLNDGDCLRAMIDSANPALTHEMIAKVLQSERISNAVKGNNMKFNMFASVYHLELFDTMKLHASQ